jgi:hypothetical protein
MNLYIHNILRYVRFVLVKINSISYLINKLTINIIQVRLANTIYSNYTLEINTVSSRLVFCFVIFLNDNFEMYAFCKRNKWLIMLGCWTICLIKSLFFISSKISKWYHWISTILCKSSVYKLYTYIYIIIYNLLLIIVSPE